MLPSFIVNKFSPKFTYDLKYLYITLTNNIRDIEIQDGTECQCIIDGIERQVISSLPKRWTGALQIIVPLKDFSIREKHVYEIRMGKSPFHIKITSKGEYIDC